VIRLFVGCAVGEDIESQMVLEYTARQHASEPLEIVWMQQARAGFWAGWNTQGWGTPFTGFRWGIPAYCGYEGRAIYMDSDFIIRADLAELWRQDIPGVLLLRRPDGKLKTCCLLIDCANAKAHLPPLTYLKAQRDQNGVMCRYFAARRQLIAAFDGDWNCVDLKGYDDLEDARIKAIHYSRMACQPHLKHAIPRLAAEGRTHWYDGEIAPHWRPDLVTLFDRLYQEAQAAGYTATRYQVEPFGPYVKKSWQHCKIPPALRATP
jgi:hypothetical protein